MQRLTAWLSGVVSWLPVHPPPDDQETFARREADLQRRLDRLTNEVNVIQRVDSSEEPEQ